MNVLQLSLESATDRLEESAAVSFVGEDPSGQFGILPGHARFMTPRSAGLCRYRRQAGDWRYLGTTGGILYCADGTLHIATRRFLTGDDPDRLSAELERQLAAEAEASRELRESLQQIEQGIVRRLWQLRRGEAGLP